MSQKTILWIVNATGSTLKRADVHSTHMNQWYFNDISPNSKQSCTVEFDSDPTGAKADALYQINDGVSFKIQAQYYTDSRGRQLQVDWSNIDTRQYTVFPPPVSGSTLSTIGWIDSGTLCVLIQTKKAALPTPPQLATLGTQWMEYYSDVLGDLTLTEMCVPGTHDSGTYKPEFILGREWIRTQSLSLRDQLNMGIRSLDLRIGQTSPGNYIITHDTWKTSYTLSQALKEVTDFIQATKKEIVVLDFHRFNNLGSGNFDFDQLKAQVKSCLQGFFIPAPEGVGNTLSQLWQRPTSAQERVAITWNNGSIDPSYMWPGVDQHWYSAADSQDKLYSALTTDFSSPPPRDTMWGSCVFRTVSVLQTPFVNAKALKGTIDSWFYGCSDWSLKANILMTDFCPDFNNVIQSSICACLLNGGKK